MCLLLLLLFLLQVMIGNAEYVCSCVQYLLHDHAVLIVSVPIAAALLIVIVIVIVVIVVLYYRHRNKLRQQDVHAYADTMPMREEQQYSFHLPDYSVKDYPL